MQVTSDGKWFWVDPPTAGVTVAAERIIALRMDEVQKFLPLAAKHDSADVEYVHQLRVSCRRAAAALRAFESFAGGRGGKLKKWLRRLRRAAGPARDADVLIARLRKELDPENAFAQQLVDDIVQSRTEAQPALAAIDVRASRGGLQRAIDGCVRRLADAKGKASHGSFAAYAQQAVGAAAEGLAIVDPQTASLGELHQLRIAGKRLRYAIEIFHCAAAPALRLDVYPQIEELQERLGAINDRAASQCRWQQWLAELPPGGLSAFTAGLIVGDHATAQRLQQEFFAWWTPERQTAVREQLTSALS
jgi:CHAD domain-containing protein